MSLPETYVFALLSGPRGLDVILRLDQIVSITGKPKAVGIQRDIDLLERRLAQFEQESCERPVPEMAKLDYDRDREQIATLERERDAEHAGSRVRMLDGSTYDVAEAPHEVLNLMHKALVGPGR